MAWSLAPLEQKNKSSGTVSSRKAQSLLPSRGVFALEVQAGKRQHVVECTKCTMTEAERRMTRFERRRQQNRESQRKFRARKEAQIQSAADQLLEAQEHVAKLQKEKEHLEITLAQLEMRVQCIELELQTRDQKSLFSIDMELDTMSCVNTIFDCEILVWLVAFSLPLVKILKEQNDSQTTWKSLNHEHIPLLSSSAMWNAIKSR